MLKVFGNVYGNNKEDLNVLVKSLENDGFQVAFQNELSGTVIKDVETLDEEPEITE